MQISARRHVAPLVFYNAMSLEYAHPVPNRRAIAGHSKRAIMNGFRFYLLANVIFVLAVTVVKATGSENDVHPLYLILLFALCSTPILDAKSLNGAYALLILFSLDYFLMYGALDVRTLVIGLEGESTHTDSVISATELVVLLGCLLVQIGYRIACRTAAKSRQSTPPKDWSELTLVVVGITLWIVCTRLSWELTVHIIAESTNEASKRGFESLGGAKSAIFILARMAQPLSILILAYAQCRYRRPYMAPLVVGVVLFQLFFGFVIDFKSEALIGGVLVVLTNFLVNGRVPKAWTALMLVVVAIGFPLLQANRVVRAEQGANTTSVSEHVMQAFRQALAAKEKVNSGSERAQTALERLTLKGSVDIIVRETGVTVPFQDGYTLAPLVTAFIPRLVLNKPSIQSGQIMNKAFNLSPSDDTYISPSHLGELYWNFGWPGVVVGMSLIGLLLGTIGAKFDLAKSATITRVLVVVVTVRLLILGSEGDIATQYVSWMRSMLIIGLLHWSLARTPSLARGDRDRAVDATPPSANGPQAPRTPFPNLLR
jgi:hypothetical protein